MFLLVKGARGYELEYQCLWYHEGLGIYLVTKIARLKCDNWFCYDIYGQGREGIWVEIPMFMVPRGFRDLSRHKDCTVKVW